MNSYRNEDLYKFILDILTAANIPFLESVPIVLSEDAYNEWKTAFISASVSKYNNYELYELAGDGALKAAFELYLFRKFPKEADVGLFSQAVNYFTSKRQLASLSEKMGLVNYVQAEESEKGTFSLAEDVFEAFLGALTLIYEKYYGDLTGLVMTQIVVRYIFDKYIFTTGKRLADYPIKDYVSRINEDINQRNFGWSVYFISRADNNGHIFTTVQIRKTRVPTKENPLKFSIMDITDIQIATRDKAYGRELAAEKFYEDYWSTDDKRKTLTQRVSHL